jgi:hypothetical protein
VRGKKVGYEELLSMKIKKKEKVPKQLSEWKVGVVGISKKQYRNLSSF